MTAAAAKRRGVSLSDEHRARLSEAHIQTGRSISERGYISVLVGRDHPMADSNGRCYEHRLVMVDVLGRPLEAEEVVHHIDEDPSNNSPENLQLFASQAAHARHHRQEVTV